MRAIQADVFDAKLLNGSIGWDLDERECGVGRHFADRHQVPLLVRPGISGRFCRTTLIEGNDKKWYTLELCERLED